MAISSGCVQLEAAVGKIETDNKAFVEGLVGASSNLEQFILGVTFDKESTDAPQLFQHAYNRNKKEVRVVKGKTKRGEKLLHVAKYHNVSTTSASLAREEVELQCREACVGADMRSSYVVCVVGYVLRPVPHVFPNEFAAIYQLDAIVYEAPNTVEFTLQQVISRRDIDVPLALPYFIRQILAAMLEFEFWGGHGIALRNFDASKIIIYRLADRTMCARLCDISAVTFFGRVGSTECADRYVPEVKQKNEVSDKSDMYCLGLVLAQALLTAASAVANYHPQVNGKQVTFEELRDMGPQALLDAMNALPARSDNGLCEIARRTLAMEPWNRLSAKSAAALLAPGKPVTFAGVGQLSAAVLEKPYEECDWWVQATSPDSGRPDDDTRMYRRDPGQRDAPRSQEIRAVAGREPRQ